MQPKGDGERKSTMVLPAVAHAPAEGVYISELGASSTSAVRTVPLGRSVQPSSALKSLLPVDDTACQVRVLGSSAAISVVSLSPMRNWPLGRTKAGESPM